MVSAAWFSEPGSGDTRAGLDAYWAMRPTCGCALQGLAWDRLLAVRQLKLTNSSGNHAFTARLPCPRCVVGRSDPDCVPGQPHCSEIVATSDGCRRGAARE